MATWDPATYLRFADERSRPFLDLTQRIGAEAPATVADLGCGPGQLTRELADRWPNAQVVGLDSSAEMVERAVEHRSDRVGFQVGDLREWMPKHPVDVIVCNASLQWVPGHRDLLPGLVSRLDRGGWLGFQVPGNFSEPSHTLLQQLAEDPRFADATRGVERPWAFGPEVYLADFAALGLVVDAWETTYLHVLGGDDPVFTWISGTGARPILQALSDDQRQVFVPEYKAMLREAYPPRPFGTILPFRRVFVVAHLIDDDGTASGEGIAR